MKIKTTARMSGGFCIKKGNQAETLRASACRLPPACNSHLGVETLISHANHHGRYESNESDHQRNDRWCQHGTLLVDCSRTSRMFYGNTTVAFYMAVVNFIFLCHGSF